MFKTPYFRRKTTVKTSFGCVTTYRFGSKVIILLLLTFTVASCEKEGSGASLKIIVRDSTYFGPNPSIISGATVRLFNNETDMLNNINQLGASQTTGSDGTAVFSDLSPDQVYAYRVETGCRTNLLRWSDTATNYHSLPALLQGGQENEVVVFITPAGAMLKLVNNGPLTYHLSAWWSFTTTLKPYETKTNHYFYGHYFITATSPNSTPVMEDSLIFLRCGDTTRLTFP